MKDYSFTTKTPLATNQETMSVFLENHFYERFDSDAQIVTDDGTYVEVENGNGELWALHASGDGDFVSHRIRFEPLN